MNHITFADFDDLQVAHETSQTVNLARFRQMMQNDGANEDTARVVMTAQDGNDYAVIDSGDGFWLVGVTNIQDHETLEYKTGEFIVFKQYETLMQALIEMITICDTDNE